MRVVIIEDEPLMSEALQEAVTKADSSIEVVAQLGSISKALDYLGQAGFPDLFFSDIELSDGLSFELFKRAQNTRPIIFCTAYNHYALEAFQVHGIDYILKPFDQEMIEKTLAKYKALFARPEQTTANYEELFAMLTQQQTTRKRSVLVHQGDKIIPVAASQVALASLHNGLSYLHTFDQQRLPVNYNMDQLHKLLGEDFYRVNRQHLISRRAISHVSQYFARKLLVHPVVPIDEELIVSKLNAGPFLKWLEQH